MKQNLFFIHGGPGMDSSYFRPWFDPLSDDFNCIYYDQKKNNLRGLIVELTEKIQAYAPIHVIAHSWGSFLLLKTLQSYDGFASSIDRIILICPMALTDERCKKNMEIVKGRFDKDDLTALDTIRDHPDQRQASVNFMTLITPYYHHDRSFDMGAVSLFNRKTSRAINEEIRDFDMREAVRHLPAETMVLYGDSDFSQPEPEYAERTKIVVIAYAGHYPFAEQQQKTLTAIRNFLSD